MAGQGVGRRQILKILGTAAAAAQFPGFSKWGFACGHIGNAALQIKPAVYSPQFFTAAEYPIVERLADLIIPSDATPGAKDAGVAEFIDFMVASDPDSQYAFRTGLTWLNAHTNQSFRKTVYASSPLNSRLPCSNHLRSKPSRVQAKRLDADSSPRCANSL